MYSVYFQMRVKIKQKNKKQVSIYSSALLFQDCRIVQIVIVCINTALVSKKPTHALTKTLQACDCEVTNEAQRQYNLTMLKLANEL